MKTAVEYYLILVWVRVALCEEELGSQRTVILLRRIILAPFERLQSSCYITNHSRPMNPNESICGRPTVRLSWQQCVPSLLSCLLLTGENRDTTSFLCALTSWATALCGTLVSIVRAHARPFPVTPKGESFQRKKAWAASTLSQPNSFLLQLGIDSTTFIPWISSFNFSATQFNNHPSDKIVESLHLRVMGDGWCE